MRQSEQDATGRWHHTIRQSDISTFRMCPEKLRTQPDESTGTDATLVGTAVHSACELYLRHPAETTESQMVELAHQQVREGWGSVRQIQMIEAEAYKFSAASIRSFWKRRHLLPQGGFVERSFKLDGVWSDQFRTISITGTPDYDTPGMIWDFKTSAMSYEKEGWMVQRYGIQPTVYCLASYLINGGEIPEFTFIRLPKDGSDMEMLTVTRTHSDFQALMYELLAMARLRESNLSHWPVKPTGWWCSPKWCETFASGKCMGAYWGDKSWAATHMNSFDESFQALDFGNFLGGNNE